MIDMNELTQGEFRSLLGQLWHHFERGEKDSAASFLVLLEICQRDEQTQEMVALLSETVYDELVGRGAGVSQYLQVLRLNANTLTLVRVVRDSAGQILYLEQYFRFVAKYVEGLAVLLNWAEHALTQDILGADEERKQSKRNVFGRTGWNSLHSQPRPMDWAVPPAAQVGSTTAATAVPFPEDASSIGDASSLDMLLALLDEAFAAEKAPAICLDTWLLELEEEEEQILWERYPQAWLEQMIAATEEDRAEIRVLRCGDAENSWLHLTDCTFTRKDVLIGYTDDAFYAADPAEMAAYLRDCRQALQLPIVDAFDFDN